jgi:hypothetical protein
MEVALEWLHEQLVSGDAQPLFVLSGSETLEVAYAATQLAAQTGGRVVAIPGASAAAPKASARISDLRGARHVLVIGDADLLDTAPGLDLWIRKARQAGAHVSVAGVGGTRIEAAGSTHELVKPGDLDAWVAQYTQRVSDAMGDHPLTEPGVIIYRDGELSAASQDLLAQTFAFPRDGSGFLAIPSAPNARGLAAIGIETAAWSDILSHTGGVVYFGVDPDRHVSVEQWGPSIKRARWVVCVDTLPTPLHAAADLVIPGAWAGEQDGTLVNLEGRLQRLTVGCEPPVKAPLQWLAGLVRRLGGKLPSHGAGAYRLLAGEVGENLPAPDHGSIPAGGVLGVTGGSAPIETPVTIPARGDDELALYVAPYLYDANEVMHADAMQFLRDDARVVMHREDARSRGLATGDHAIVTLDGDVDVLATVTTNRRIAAGHARIHAGTGDVPAGRTGWTVASVRAASIVLQSGNGEG